MQPSRVHSGVIHGGRDTGTAAVRTGGRRKQKLWQIQSGTLCPTTKKEILPSGQQGWTRGYCAKRKESGGDRQATYALTYIWDL